MSRQFDYLADVEVFLIVAEKLSISAAAIDLSTTPSVIKIGDMFSGPKGANCFKIL